MGTNDKKHIGVVVPIEMARALSKKSKAVGISMSAYCVEVLKQWLASGKKMSVTEE
jgi:hypothetical protein